MDKVITQAELLAEGKRLFGDDILKWKFKCPSCGIEISIKDYKDAKAPETAIGFNCIGRYLDTKNPMLSGKQPCDYTSGGLICISPIEVVFPDGKKAYFFDFAR